MRPIIDRFRGPYIFLSNFHQRRFKWRGITWPSAEHAFQAAKTASKDEMRRILKAKTPRDAKRLGRKVTMRPGWEGGANGGLRVKAMHSVLKAKFSDPEMRAALLATGDAELVEGNDWNDTFWGAVNGRGQNWLGVLLMELRESLRHNEVRSAVDSGLRELKPRCRVLKVTASRDRSDYPGDAVYIGRNRRLKGLLPDPNGREWGNPYKVTAEHQREPAVKRYMDDLVRELASEISQGRDDLLMALSDLDGWSLVCHCAPRMCHGNAIAMLAAWANDMVNDMNRHGVPTDELASFLATGRS